ncbi:hypothetical protein SEA_IZZY_33 [Streptomyces phage Izzy]|uniref:Uncharacterized protein n=6 Tax=Likavirus izzy TaxID=1982888 RepID=A0A2U8UTR9_9CAUD|nr:hypothetical protein AVT27_gp33 [Streptomyces phage Izzy]ATE84986.1 hypothetical protein SEA_BRYANRECYCLES_33 [Streptomyces phage BryanRecycles]ATE85287.1 hypothetical protein SEA_JASH_33 [Streptomyces phage Jash]ATE85363.1 hypothetical protein SEA_OLIYNYK_33 [Streptomyces phage Oliynyk]AWN07476.1 hypothetical protein SEA_EDDASA_33 [Streptomyces phage Eddasa]QDK03964.1 hypothetical protein SEA_RUSTICUS_33 [Streptomyces phage Rusticus]WJN62888.1 hypothetical protein [Streptomyces phage phiS
MSRELSVTIKYGKSYDDTWAVFKGTPDEIRSDIVSFFGIMPDAVTEMTLSEIVTAATDLAHGKGNAARFLGATVVPSQSAPAQPAQTAAPASNEDPWAAAASSAPSTPSTPPAPQAEDPNAWILGEIEKQTSVDSLKRLWAENQSFFKDSAVMAAWKAKGKALSAA